MVDTWLSKEFMI